MKYTLRKSTKKKSAVVDGLLDLKTAAYYPHYDFLYQQIEGGNLKILDFGCGEGLFAWLLTHKVKIVYAFDVDPRKIGEAKKRFPEVQFFCGQPGQRLPFPNSFFDAIVTSHILEHVQNESETIHEITRILKPRGTLYIVSPYKGLLTFLDAGNIRYRFPNLHKWLYSLIFGKIEYEKTFKYPRRYGLYGDCWIDRKWHHHYTQTEIEQLLMDKFQILRFKKFSFFCPILLIIKGFWENIFKRSNSFIDKLVLADHQFEVGNFSYTFFVKAKNTSA